VDELEKYSIDHDKRLAENLRKLGSNGAIELTCDDKTVAVVISADEYERTHPN
jgi:hypothetical protein